MLIVEHNFLNHIYIIIPPIRCNFWSFKMHFVTTISPLGVIGTKRTLRSHGRTDAPKTYRLP